jgi:beta-N-acetylhexosaminidase
MTTLTDIIGQKLMLAFAGHTPPAELATWLSQQPVAGFTLFRHLNVANPDQIRTLTGQLQRLAQTTGQPPFLLAADQEGGQLIALGDGLTPFPGNMALGASGDPALARRTGKAMGRELRALGINVNYAPVCDVNSNPQNPVIGSRAFGGNAELVAQMSAAFIEGMQSVGVACAAKHFPGHGDTVQDSHHVTPIVAHDWERLETVELRPFRAAIAAGVKLVMTAHLGLPTLNNGLDLPATLSRPVLHGLLRQEMSFDGVIVSDALDMGAIAQGAGLTIDLLAATLAGVDLLLLTADPQTHALAAAALRQAQQRALLPDELLQTSARRVLALKEWLAGFETPSLSVVGCASHRALAQEIAERSVTLVQDKAGLLPLRLPSQARIAAIMPRPKDLTPADTSSYVTPALAAALRTYHRQVDEFITGQPPTTAEISALRTRVTDYDLLIVGTINASSDAAQVDLVQALLQTAVPTITVALRTPYDLEAYPQAQTHACTYSLLPPALEALAAALWGQIEWVGKRP